MISIKLKDLETVKKEMSEYGYEFLDNKYMGDKYHYNFIDENGYRYFSFIQTIKTGKKPRAVSVHNPYVIENIKLWCILNKKKFILRSKLFTGVNDKLIWECTNPKCKDSFDMEWHVVKDNNGGCPYCAGRRVNHRNSLSTNHPEIAKEWHPTKNGNLLPSEISKASGRKAWWLCSVNSNHEWQAKIQNRTINSTGCPYCSGRNAHPNSNLTISHPELIKEWNYKKNKLTPDQYTKGTRRKVWWICSKGHEWESDIANRALLKRGCPVCNESKGEKQIRTSLLNNEVKFEDQKEFNNLFGLKGGLLSYDFYLPEINMLIEYQGQFHDGSSGEFSRLNLSSQIEHDKRKRNFAMKNNINLLEIWYWDFENIEDILKEKII